DILAVMFESDNEIDLKLVSEMHTLNQNLSMRIRQRGELIFEVERLGYLPKVFESVKLLKDLQEYDMAKERLLVDEVPDTLMRLVEKLVVWNDFRCGEYIWRHLYDQILNVVYKNKWEHLQGLSKSRNYVPTYTLSGFVWSFKDSKVNLDLTPTKAKHQSDWYMFFREFYMAYISRTPSTRYPDLFDDYLKKLAASHKRGKINTKDLPIIHRCDTSSVEEIRLKDRVITELNSRVFKLEAIIKVIGRERNGVFVDKLDFGEYFGNFSSQFWDKLNDEFIELFETPFLSTRSSMVDVDSDDDVVKVESGAYYWGNAFAVAKKDRPSNGLNDQDMTQLLKVDLLRPLRCRFPWCKDVSVDQRFWESLVCLDPPKKGWIIDEHARPHDADWAMVGGYFVQLLLQDFIPLWYVDGTRYKVSWSDIDQVFMPINEMDQHWCLAQLNIRTRVVTFYNNGVTYEPEWREWYITLRDCLKLWKSSIDCSNFIISYGVRKSDTCSFHVNYLQGFQSYMGSVDYNFTYTPLNTSLNFTLLSPITTSEGL
ncbi:phospholipase-like protein, partial [Tanacetum coccineum]